jgi:hypothetical protein
MRASLTLSGSGLCQRSGFHSKASGPNVVGSTLTPRMSMKIPVPLGIMTSQTPSLAFEPEPRGWARGRIVSCNALGSLSKFRCCTQMYTYTRSMRATGGCLGRSGRLALPVLDDSQAKSFPNHRLQPGQRIQLIVAKLAALPVNSPQFISK